MDRSFRIFNITADINRLYREMETDLDRAKEQILLCAKAKVAPAFGITLTPDESKYFQASCLNEACEHLKSAEHKIDCLKVMLGHRRKIEREV